ncbi:Ribosome maturation factor RimM [termite gut metagenome]|uniref:Ribosome maturation factor RimM n=1 Tax=termite gut metagenome TaxID=433724 RepID=A0A5J4RBS9_9ZZZZ
MIKREEVYKIGIFNKPHGIHGELSFRFTDDVFDRAGCEYLICLLEGIFVPFYMENYRFCSDTTALIKLEGVDSAERARMFTHTEVYFPIKYKVEDTKTDKESPLDVLIGFEIEDGVLGKLGQITAVDSSTINTLFIIESERGELLIPACEEFIVKCDYKKKRIRMDLPQGLVHLDAAAEV